MSILEYRIKKDALSYTNGSDHIIRYISLPLATGDGAATTLRHLNFIALNREEWEHESDRDAVRITFNDYSMHLNKQQFNELVNQLKCMADGIEQTK
jgi:hypothetical protein